MNKPHYTPDALRKRLSSVPFLAGLQDDVLDRLASVGTTQEVTRGDVLVAEGEAADTLFFVLQGRFTVTLGDTPIAELDAGEPVGEIAFFAGGARTATVTAARASTVLALTRSDYDAVAADKPALGEAIIRALAARVVAGNPARPHVELRAPRILAVLPVTGARLPEDFVAKLIRTAALSGGPVRVLSPEANEDASQMRSRISEAEATASTVVLLIPDTEAQPDWAEIASQSADSIALVAPLSAEPQPPAPLQTRLLRGLIRQNIHLVLLRDQASTPILGTAAWLAERPIGQHHHVALDATADFERLARFLTGTATGLVFCGGAAFGTAHLGMLKALKEHGYAFDMVGGSSMGSAMAGGYAMGLAPAEVMDIVDELFLKSGAMKRYTAPVWSVIDHQHFDRELRRVTRSLNAEDLPLPFFAVATSLTRNDITVLREGPLWRAIRASTAIPALFPPMVMPDGEVMIDGGLIDNAPLGPMRDLKPGPNLVMNITRAPDWRVRTPYETLPGRGGALRRMLLPGGKRVRFPGIFSVLSRTMVVNSERLMAHVEPRDDVILTMPPLPRMGFLDWTKGRALFDRSYKVMSEKLESHPASEEPRRGTGPDARLRAIAAELSSGAAHNTTRAPRKTG